MYTRAVSRNSIQGTIDPRVGALSTWPEGMTNGAYKTRAFCNIVRKCYTYNKSQAKRYMAGYVCNI